MDFIHYMNDKCAAGGHSARQFPDSCSAPISLGCNSRELLIALRRGGICGHH
ncbi:hypothetical protein [Synechococcus sp. CBW1108]|uniref:hypothetical protein n=1 Tax=Synechococcus sp. CBW1108 TaxID=1353147 RepID=UPI0018CC836B|nr:hypothetical protein [Synechococcus sp. CBW1108]QPN71189.1 hypothetical protein H8F27_06300 [Synechococcus sp. CBW1108]